MSKDYSYIALETMLYRILKTHGLQYVEETLNPGLEFENVHVASIYDNYNYENLDLGSLIVHPIRRRPFFRKFLYPFNEILGNSLQVFKIIKKNNIKLIWSIGGSLHDNGAVALISGKLAQIPTVVSIMNNYDMKYLYYPDYFLHNVFLNEVWERIILKNATKVRVISKELIKYAIRHGVPQKRVVYIPRKVKLSSFGTIRNLMVSDIEKRLNIENKQKILFVGRLTQQKNVRTMIKAISFLVDAYQKDLVFLIAGDGPLMKKLQHLINELNLQDYVFLLGRIPHVDLRQLYECSNIFLFPTLFEGLGRAILEAMIFGLPIVTTNYGPVTELVKHEKNGYLVDPNDPHEISQALIRLLENRELQQAFGKQSTSFIEKYDFSLVDKIEIEFIKRIIDDHSA